MRRPKADDEGGFQRFEKFLEEWSRRDFMKRTGGAAAFAAFMAGVPEVLAACGPSQGPGPAASPVKGGHIVEGHPSDMRHFMSVLISDTISDLVAGRCFEGLLDRKANGDMIPAIAESVPSAASDGVTYTFKLRKDVKWSDGQPVTSDDVLFTYNLMFDPSYKDVNSPRRGDLEKNLASITAPDQFTFVFKTKKVWAKFITSQTTYGILPKHVLGSLAPKALNTAPFDSNPTVVNGAFKFVKWDKSQQVVLARNDTYYRGAPLLDQFVFKVVPDSVAAGNQLKTGELDAGIFSASLVDTMRTAPNVDLKIFDGPSFDYYGYQNDPAKPSYKFFGAKTVRQALLYALDRQKIVDSVYFGQAILATGFEPTVSWAYDPNVKPKYTFDKKKAEEMLDAAGWEKGASGIREKDGVPFRFEILTNVGNKERENLIVVMQQQWKDIGVDASPKPIQFQQLVTQLTNQRTFDCFMLGFNLDPDPDQAEIWGSESARPGGFNGMPYKNPEADRLFEDALETLDRNKRKEIYFKIQDIFAEDAVAPILHYPKRLWAVSKRVQNFGVGPFNQYGPRPWMKDVFVTDGK